MEPRTEWSGEDGAEPRMEWSGEDGSVPRMERCRGRNGTVMGEYDVC
jgi:hypothetical protein